MQLDLLDLYGDLVAAFQVRLKGDDRLRDDAVKVYADVQDLHELAGAGYDGSRAVDDRDLLVGHGHHDHALLYGLVGNADRGVDAYGIVLVRYVDRGGLHSRNTAHAVGVQAGEVELRSQRASAAAERRGQGHYFKGYVFHKFSPFLALQLEA